MALDVGTISTGVDKLIRLVKESGRIDINDAASRMGISRQVLEEWAQVLEEQGLIRIEYQLTKVYLISIAATKEEIEDKKERISDERKAIVRQAESHLEELVRLGQDFDAMRGEFSRVGEQFEQRLGGVGRRLEELQQLKRQREELRYAVEKLHGDYANRLKVIGEEVSKGYGELGEALEQWESLHEQLKVVKPRIIELRTEKTELQGALKDTKKQLDTGVAKASAKAGDIDSEIKERDKEYESLLFKAKTMMETLKRGRESFADFSKQLEVRSTELGEASKIADEVGKKSKEINIKFMELGSQKKGFDMDIEKARKEVVSLGLDKIIARADSLSKDIDGRLKDYGELAKKADAIEVYLKENKKSFADMKKLVVSTSAELAETLKAKQALEADVKELGLRLVELRSAKDGFGVELEKARKEMGIGLDKVVDQYVALSQEIESKSKSYAALSKKAEAIDDQLREDKKSLSELKKTAGAGYPELDAMLKEVGSFSSKLGDLEPKLAKFRAERDDLNKAVEKARKRLLEIDRISKEAGDASKALELHSKEYREFMEGAEALDKQFGKDREAFAKLKQDFDSKVADFDAMLKSVAALSSKLEWLKPELEEFRSIKGELENSTTLAGEKLKQLEKFLKSTDELAQEAAARDKDYAALFKKAEVLDTALMQRKDAVFSFTKELESKVADLEAVQSKAGSELERISLDLEKEANSAEDLIKNFQERVNRVREVGSHFETLAEERKGLSEGLAKIVRDMKELDAIENKLPMDEVIRRVDEARKNLEKMSARTDEYDKAQKQIKTSLKKIWALEEKEAKGA